jgi:hypothetical protein
MAASLLLLLSVYHEPLPFQYLLHALLPRVGWYLLGALALGIGVFFVMPYENATNAELYLVLRDNALANNLCSYEDLLLDRPIFDDNNGMW